MQKICRNQIIKHQVLQDLIFMQLTLILLKLIVFRPRSGLFLKHGLSCILGTIDSDFRGEIKILLVNLSTCSFIIHRGMRIAQIVFCDVIKAKLIKTESLDSTYRGDKGFGSTG